jgi:hypothetical protein
MSTYVWIVHDAQGRDLRTTDLFPTREAAEEWLGREWQSLADESGDSVSLVENGEVVYQMSLRSE